MTNESQPTNPYEGVTSEADAAEALISTWDRESDNPEQEAGAPKQPEQLQADDADTEDEDSDEEQPDAEAKDDDAEQEQEADDKEPEETLITVTVDGEEQQVTLDQLRSGFMLQSDYTRKAQQVAEARKEFAQQQQQASQEAQQQVEQLGFLVNQMVENLTNTENSTNWEELRQLDPAEYAAKREHINHQREQLKQAYGAYQQHQEQGKKLQQQQMQQLLADESTRLIGAVPEWSDPEKRTSEQTALKGYLAGQGFTEQEINGIYDHRHVIQLRKAMLYDQLQAKQQQTAGNAKAKKVKDLPKVRAGGASNPEDKLSAQQKASKRLAKTGTVDAAVDWLTSRAS